MCFDRIFLEIDCVSNASDDLFKLPGIITVLANVFSAWGGFPLDVCGGRV